MIHGWGTNLGYSYYFEVVPIFFSRNFFCLEEFLSIHLVDYEAWLKNQAICWPYSEFRRRALEDTSYLVGLEHLERDVYNFSDYLFLYFLAVHFLTLRTVRKLNFAPY